jgi:hypothetical protein
MFVRSLLIIGSIAILIGTLIGGISCSSEVSASLGKEFTLPIGKTAAIGSENISLKFDKVTTDSRCPKGVVCVWAGEARSLIYFNSINTNDPPTALELVEQGGQPQGFFQATRKFYGATYLINFRLEPYPEAEKQINNSDYVLIMLITK